MSAGASQGFMGSNSSLSRSMRLGRPQVAFLTLLTSIALFSMLPLANEANRTWSDTRDRVVQAGVAQAAAISAGHTGHNCHENVTKRLLIGAGSRV